MLSSGIARDIQKKFSDRILRLSDKASDNVKALLNHHVTTLATVDAKHYFLLPSGDYKAELFFKPLSFWILTTLLVNSIFNILFQPVFPSLFAPQVILNVVIFPFFLYGAVRYFKKVWFMLVVFIFLSFIIGIYDSAIEALMRHGMPCELIYLLIGSAGFTGWVTRN